MRMLFQSLDGIVHSANGLLLSKERCQFIHVGTLAGSHQAYPPCIPRFDVSCLNPSLHHLLDVVDGEVVNGREHSSQLIHLHSRGFLPVFLHELVVLVVGLRCLEEELGEWPEVADETDVSFLLVAEVVLIFDDLHLHHLHHLRFFLRCGLNAFRLEDMIEFRHPFCGWLFEEILMVEPDTLDVVEPCSVF